MLVQLAHVDVWRGGHLSCQRIFVKFHRKQERPGEDFKEFFKQTTCDYDICGQDYQFHVYLLCP